MKCKLLFTYSIPEEQRKRTHSADAREQEADLYQEQQSSKQDALELFLKGHLELLP